jgi:protein gp37
MADNSTIEWTEATWNPVTGCTKISPGCDHCYAERMSRRLHAMGNHNYRNGFKLTVQPQMLERPLQWAKPKFVFVNSMSDLFHRDVPTPYIHEVFDVMRRAYWHQFQVLTKRASRLARISDSIDWPPNVWMGVSVEDEHHRFRVDLLRHTGAAIKFLSLEPLIGAMRELDLELIDWVIVGGESGPGARAMAEKWVLDIQRQCRKSNVAFFFKQWGGVNKKKTGRQLRGKTWDEMPSYTAIPNAKRSRSA